MDIEAFFEGMPFADMLGVEVTEAADGHAEGYLEMREELSWNEDPLMAHGGVTFTLADTVGWSTTDTSAAPPTVSASVNVTPPWAIIRSSFQDSSSRISR